MLFLKYHHAFSYGDSEEEIQFITLDDFMHKGEIEELVEAIESKYSFSDRYYGIEYAVVSFEVLDPMFQKKFYDECLRQKKSINKILSKMKELGYEN